MSHRFVPPALASLVPPAPPRRERPCVVEDLARCASALARPTGAPRSEASARKWWKTATVHAGRAAWTVQRYRRVRTRALRLPSRGGGHGVRVRPGAGRKTRRAARRRRDSATTLLVADPPTALAVTAEGASCAARAVLSDSVSCMLAARVPADRFSDGVPGAGREPNVVCW
eukprot:scaffold73255_cov60-Phaeocystis_antarctica.AAC.4